MPRSGRSGAGLLNPFSYNLIKVPEHLKSLKFRRKIILRLVQEKILPVPTTTNLTSLK